MKEKVKSPRKARRKPGTMAYGDRYLRMLERFRKANGKKHKLMRQVDDLLDAQNLWQILVFMNITREYYKQDKATKQPRPGKSGGLRREAR